MTKAKADQETEAESPSQSTQSEDVPEPEETAPVAEGKSEEWANEPVEYDPFTDPDVPDTALAQVISVELLSGDSPTLEALRDAKK